MSRGAMADKLDKAVALSFAEADPTVPAIVASGTGALARRIVDIAFEHGVKVREDPDLIEILATLDIGERIPAVAFAAVAEILAHVYRWDSARQETVRQEFHAAAAP